MYILVLLPYTMVQIIYCMAARATRQIVSPLTFSLKVTGMLIKMLFVKFREIIQILQLGFHHVWKHLDQFSNVLHWITCTMVVNQHRH